MSTGRHIIFKIAEVSLCGLFLMKLMVEVVFVCFLKIFKKIYLFKTVKRSFIYWLISQIKFRAELVQSWKLGTSVSGVRAGSHDLGPFSGSCSKSRAVGLESVP